MAEAPPTYASLQEANTYFEWSLNSDAWDSASSLDRTKALVAATRSIDRLNFAGVRTSDWNLRTRILSPSAPPGQLLEFPRNGDTEIPTDIKNACCEIAYALLDGVDPELEMQSLDSTGQRIASVSVSFDLNAARMAFRHGIASYTAWSWLYPYLADPHEITLSRVS